jgi:hypothetical protein
LRVTDALPMTASGKVTKEPLKVEGWWRGDDRIFHRVGPDSFRLMNERDREVLLAEFRRHSRQGLVGR